MSVYLCKHLSHKIQGLWGCPQILSEVVFPIKQLTEIKREKQTNTSVIDFIFSLMYSVPLCCNILLFLFQEIEKDEWFVFFFAYGLHIPPVYCFCLLIWLVTKFMTDVIKFAFNDLYNR